MLQDSIQLTDSWILLAGVRYDQVHELTGKRRPFVTGAVIGKDNCNAVSLASGPAALASAEPLT